MGHLPCNLDDLQIAESPAVAKVVGATALVESAQREDVRACQVDDVDVVAHAGAIRGRVVIAEDREVRCLAQRDAEDERDDVRLGQVMLANALGCPGGVEVPEGCKA